MISAIEEFRAAIRECGIEPPESVEADGKLRRFSSNGKRGDDAGWYVFHDDGIAAGAFGDWRSGINETWRADIGRKLTPSEEVAHWAKVEAMHREREAEEARQHAEAATKALRIWEAAPPAPENHPYLKRKGIKPHAARVHEDKLLIPMRDAAGKLWNVERIAPEKPAEGSDKKGLFGGRRIGCYFSIGKPDGTLCITEGYATGASIHEATGYAVAVAFSAGNLEAVAKALHSKLPDIRIIIAGDNDASGKGQRCAEEAAQAVGALVAIPSEAGKDWNDIHRERGAQAVKVAIEKAQPVTQTLPHTFSELVTSRFSDIAPQPISWLWPDQIARGKLTIIAGDPGLGKSQVTTSLAAIVTKGGGWPVDLTFAERGRVIFLSAEDDPADTIRPRLDAAGADVSLCEIVQFVRVLDRDGNQTRRAFNLKADMMRLSALLAERGDVALVIIDPVTAYCGDTDTHRTSDVRAVLAEVSEVAGRHKAAFVAVSHLNKGDSAKALQRVTGSLAFVAAARAVFLVAEDQAAEGQKLFVPMKNNIGSDKTGYAYRIEGVVYPGGIKTSRISWASERVTITADEALTPDTEDKSELDSAKTFLEEELKGGPVSSRTIQKDAEDNGYAWRTIRRAKDDLGVRAEHPDIKGPWIWRLPDKVAKNAQDVQDPDVDTLSQNGRLGEPESAQSSGNGEPF